MKKVSTSIIVAMLTLGGCAGPSHFEIDNRKIDMNAGVAEIPAGTTIQQWQVQYGSGDKISCKNGFTLLGYPIIEQADFFDNNRPAGRLSVLFDKNDQYQAQGKEAEKLCSQN